MKKTFHILTAALLLTAGALLTTGCGNDDTAIDNGKDQPAQGRTVMFTATLAPKGDNSGQTRAITPGTDPDDGNKEILNVAWKKNEEIAVYYQTGSNPDTYAKATANVDAVNDGVATISATLIGAIDGGSVKFVYPASMMKSNGDIYWWSLYNHQQGYLTTPESSGGSGQGQSEVTPSTIKTISHDFDLATGTGTIAVNGSEASVSGKVKMANECCICKFNISIPVSEQVSTVTHYDITVAFAGGDTYKLSEIPKDRLNELYVAMRPVSKVQATITAEGYISSGGGISSTTILSTHSKVINSVDLVAGRFYRNVPVHLRQNVLTPVTGNVSLTPETGELLLGNGAIVTGTGGANTILLIEDGATVTLNGVTNTGITQKASIAGIECLGDATIILTGTNSVTGRWDAPGILVPSGKALTIMGNGTLHASGGSNGAGIGGTKDTSCGNIVIAGGTITATGTGNCAGIGSGCANGANITCGAITISGGTVTATGGPYAAGIGSGHAGDYTNDCGTITISGGTVTATGGDYAVGIGSGNADQASNTCGDITIRGSAKVKAVGKTYAAGIGTGCGYDADKNCICGMISITGGTVEATGGDHAAGIGSGSHGKFTSISIISDITSVTATKSNNFWNVPIGKGNDDQDSGAVTFGTETMHDGREEYINPSDWIHWPTDGQTYGGIKVAVSTYGSEGLTWTLTP